MREKRNVMKGLAFALCLMLCVSLFFCNQTAYANDNLAEQAQEIEENSEIDGETEQGPVDESEKDIDEKSSEKSNKGSEDIINEQNGKEQVEENSSAPVENNLLKAPITRSVERSGVITKLEILMEDGSGPVTGGVGQWQVMRLNAEFALPNNTVQAGDTTTISLPQELRFYKTDTFPIMDEFGNVIAMATADGTAKTLTLTYTNFPETHSNVGGNFYFYVRVDRNVVTEEKDIPLVFDVSGEIIIGGTIHYNGPRDPTPRYIGKSGEQSGSKPNELSYQLNINTVKADINGVVVTDKIETSGVKYIQDSLKIGKGRWEAVDGDWWFMDEVDVTGNYDVIWNDDGSSFSINLGNISASDGFQIKYRAKGDYVFLDGERIKNSANISGSNIETVPASGDITYHQGGGSGQGYVYAIKIVKQDREGNALAGAEFDVIRVATGAKVGTITTDSTGEGSITGLLQDECRLVETKAPDGYKILNDPVEVSVNDYNSDKIAIKTVLNEPATTSVRVQKMWIGAGKESATINLFRQYEFNGGVVKEDTGLIRILNNENNWTASFDNLEKYSPEGIEYTYYVEESPISGYKIGIVETGKNSFIVTNTNAETVDIPVKKNWVGTPSEGAKLVLIQDGENKEEVDVGTEDGWTYTFKDLAKYDFTDGHVYEYDVKEIGLDDSYIKDKEGSVSDGFTFTNTITGKTEVSVKKEWIGPGKKQVTVELMNGDRVVDTAVLSADNNWQHTFRGLDKYDNGKEIKYEIKEERLEGYESKVTGDIENGFTVTNTNKATVNIPVSKEWVGEPAKGVEIKLTADGTIVDTVTLDETKDWSYTFSDLPVYDKEDGHEIIYDVQEDDIEGYISGRSGTVETGFTFTNTITGKVSVPVTKVWEGPKTESVIIELYADGAKADEIMLNSANGWQHTFENLEKYKDGKEISYEVKEPDVKNYKTKISGNANDGYIVKNVNTEVRSVDVTKKWVGDPVKKVLIHLYADGEEIDSMKLTKSMGWKGSFKELPVYAKDGHRISYTISEDELKGYTSKITGDDETGFTVTNTKDSPPAKDKEKKTTNKNSPKTGDTSNVAGCMIALLISAFMLAGLIFRKRKSE